MYAEAVGAGAGKIGTVDVVKSLLRGSADEEIPDVNGELTEDPAGESVPQEVATSKTRNVCVPF